MQKCEQCKKTSPKGKSTHLVFTYRESKQHEGLEIASQKRVCEKCYPKPESLPFRVDLAKIQAYLRGE